MKTQVLPASDPAAVAHAAQIIQSGGVVVFPTETVYGLGADGLTPHAVQKIFAAKQRPADNPLILHISEREQLSEVAFVDHRAEHLIQNFWPGPLTLVLPKKSVVPDVTAAGLDTVAVRMPAHLIARELIRASQTVVAAPSANISSKPSPTNAKDVLEDMFGKVDVILDGGRCAVGLESTVLDITQETPIILRPGSITQEELEATIGPITLHTAVQGKESSTQQPASPGMKYKHYAPRAEVIVVRSSALQQVCMNFDSCAVITFQSHLPLGFKQYVVKDVTELSQNLYAIFRECDREHISKIVVEAPQQTGLGVALNNRLYKAASKVI